MFAFGFRKAIIILINYEEPRHMSRIVQTQPRIQERRGMLKLLLYTLEHINSPDVTPGEQRDMAAFALKTLEKVHESIEQSAGAWEKRGYWNKADKLRLEWSWLEGHAATLKQYLRNEIQYQDLMERVQDMKHHLQEQGITTRRLRDQAPWRGAYQLIKDKLKS